jgi:hypothetical protein
MIALPIATLRDHGHPAALGRDRDGAAVTTLRPTVVRSHRVHERRQRDTVLPSQ